MTIIEQAARRLEQLRRSGIEVPDAPAAAPPSVGASMPAQAAQRADQLRTALDQPSAPAPQVPAVPAVPAAPRPPSRTSREVLIDLDRLAGMGYLTPNTPRARIADEFRIIKRPLLANAHGRSATPVERSNLIMVTSSLPGEGKTFVSVNLAISLAMELDTTVLLVDADVSRPAVLPRLGLPQSPGLMDLLTNRSLDVSDVLMRTNIDKLSLLPAGRPQGRATELLSSDEMTRLVDELANRYPDRVLVFDAPPLLPSTESRVLATHMGQVIVVVESERTAHKAVQQAMATLEACPVVMTLLNKITRSEVGAYYGYYDANEA